MEQNPKHALEGQGNYSYPILRAVIEGTTDAVFVKDLQGHYLMINSAGARFIGKPVEEIIGKTDLELFSSDTGQQIMENDRRIMVLGETQTIEELGTSIGVTRTYLSTKGVYRDHQGKAIGLIGTCRDITERKKAENRLARINECFLSFGTDPHENIARLTALCGELLEATFACYNRLDSGMLSSLATWQAPPSYQLVSKPDGHICYDVINRPDDGIVVVSNLQQTLYAKSDANISAYKLQTYVGKAVKCEGIKVGSICVFYQNNFIPSEADKKILGIIASAIGIEDERMTANESLRHTLKRVQQLSQHILSMQEDQYKTISRELHDNIAQSLNALKLKLEKVDRNSHIRGNKELARTRQEIKETISLLMRLSQQIRRLSKQMRPEVLDELGLIIALQSYIRDFQNMTGIQTDFIFGGRTTHFSPGIETQLYRIVQEGLSNIAKHAQASYVVVSLRQIKNELILSILDNGVGFFVDPLKKEEQGLQGLGLITMQERTNLLKGSIEIASGPGNGTKIMVKVRS